MSDKLNRDVDRAIEDFFEALMLIASKHDLNPLDVSEVADKRGADADGFFNWLGDES
jgi:hypothetical protein